MTSLWIATAPHSPRHERLAGDVTADAVVLGAGIAGLTTAYLLQRRGVDTVVLEAREVARGVTGHTTAKVTSLHELTYRDLDRRHGRETARHYGAANQAAVEFVRQLVSEHGIECDLTDASAFTVSRDAGHADDVAEEVEVARSIGLPARAAKVDELPFDVHAAVEFAGQFHFHPLAYLTELSRLFVEAGGRVFERSAALAVEESRPSVVRTSEGRVTADHVVVATHQPFMLDGWYFARLRQKRSFAMALEVDGVVPRGMHISVGGEFVTLRPAVVDGTELLIFGGEKHSPGQEPDTRARLRRLEERARSMFRVRSVRHWWATHDNVTGDGLPFIGRLKSRHEHVYVATGFAGWGMSNGTASAMILADLVTGTANPHASVFDPQRTQVGATLKGCVRDIVDTSRTLLGGFDADDAPDDIERISRGGGAIVSHGTERLAVHRDDDGDVHAVDAVCTHLQCTVRWNDAERSWDCACHGSRFDVDGEVLHGPATRPLPRVDGVGVRATAAERDTAS